MTRLFALGLAAVVLGAPTLALAEGESTIVEAIRADDVPVAYVRLDGLDLASDKGVKTLRRMVRTAAYQVCFVAPGGKPLGQRAREDKCTSAALNGAEPQITRAISRYKERDFAGLPPIKIAP